MQNDLISIEPQIIQFNRQPTQTIKITNNTTQPLNHFFFCLYNVEKFSFTPQTFSLLPQQHKLIQITLKINSTKSIAKQFAYLKSTEVNKRLTLLINNFNSPEMIRNRQTEEVEDNLNTLSSRDYHELHNRALNKIINEQKILEEGNGANNPNQQMVREFNKTENFSIGSLESGNKHDFFNNTHISGRKSDYINISSNHNNNPKKQLSLRKQYTSNNNNFNSQHKNQQQQYIKQLQQRTQQLEKQLQQMNDAVNRGNFEMEKMQNENKYLNEQVGKFMKKASEKQIRIKELQGLYEKIVEQAERHNMEAQQLRELLQRERQLSSKSDKQRKEQLNSIYKSYEERIKQLQNAVESSSSRNNSLTVDKFNSQFRKQIQKKDNELEKIRRQLEHQELLIRQHQINLMKAESENKSLKQKKDQLESDNMELIEVNNNLKEEIFVYKSRIMDDGPNGSNNNSAKLQQYLEIALQSYKTENENLKKSKFELQKSLEGIITTNRQAESQNSLMQSKIDTLNIELNKLQQEVTRQELIKQQLKAQHHQKIKEITNKNILLLENLTLQNNTQRIQQTDRLNRQIREKQQLIQEIKLLNNKERIQLQEKLSKQSKRIKELQEQNSQLEQKVKKYKKQTKRQLKSINDNAFDQLRRIHEQKKALQKKVNKLEKLVFKLQAGTNYMSGNGVYQQSSSNRIMNSKNEMLAGTSDVMNSKSQLNVNSSNSYGQQVRNRQQVNLQEDSDSENTLYNYDKNDKYEKNNNYNNNANINDEVNPRSHSQYQLPSNRRTGIFNQRHRLYDSRSASTKNGVIFEPNNNKSQIQHQHQQPNYQLFQLRQFSAFVHNEQQRFQYMFNLQSQLMDPLDYNGKPLNNIKPLYKAIKFFKVIEQKLKEINQKAEESFILNKENAFMKEKLNELEKSQNQNKGQNYSNNKKDMSNIMVTNPLYPHQNTMGNNKLREQEEDGPSFLLNRTNLTNMNVFQMIEFLKNQMKKQYNKQFQTIKFIEEKYEILQKKIYREYRTRIVEIINENNEGKKDTVQSNLITIGKLQNLLERFVQGLSNMSHKQAVLGKEIKIKNTYKNENTKLRQRIQQLEGLLDGSKQYGHGWRSYLNRQQSMIQYVMSKVNNNNTVIAANNNTTSNLAHNLSLRQQQWAEAIKLSAQLLTQKAESERLRQELNVVRQDYLAIKQQSNELNLINQEKDLEIMRLKKNQLQLQKQYEKQLQKQNLILQETKSKLASGNNSTKTKTKNVIKLEQKLKDKQKQIELIRQQIEKKNQLIKTYKQKQKKWEQYIQQTNRSEEKQKSLASSYRRMEENHSLVKQNNRQLRQQNNQLKDIVDKLQKELQKKKLYIKNLKQQEEQTRITKPLRVQQTQQLIKELEETLRTTKEQLSKIKRNKQKEIIKLENDLSSVKNQSLIHIRSLQSVLRATLDAIKRVYNSLKIYAKKKGVKISNQISQINVPENIVEVSAAEIYQKFDQVIQLLDN